MTVLLLLAALALAASSCLPINRSVSYEDSGNTEVMWFSSLAVYTLVLQNTFAGVASLGSLAAVEQPQNEVSVLEARVNCNGGGNFVVYEFNNGDGGRAMLCINGFVAAGCVVLLSGGMNVIEALKNKVTN